MAVLATARDKKTRRLFSEYGPKVSLLAARMIANPEIAREAAQETWCQVLTALPSFRGDSSIGTWIFTIAKRTILRYAKRERTHSAAGIDEFFSRGEIFYTGSEHDRDQWVKERCFDCLTAFCHCLKADDRLLFVFREIIRLPYQDISPIMSLDESTMRQRLSRSRSRMKKFLNDNCILYNPSGNCRCRIKKQVKSIGLDHAFSCIEHTSSLIRFFKKAGEVLPTKNFWKKELLRLSQKRPALH